jgi:hypothetical protein
MRKNTRKLIEFAAVVLFFAVMGAAFIAMMILSGAIK